MYARVLKEDLHTEPEPIDMDKMMMFLVFMKRQGRAYSTLVNYARSFSFAFRSRGLDVLTNHIRFKVFLTGLRRVMTQDGSATGKDPFLVDWFELIVQVRPIGDPSNRRMLFWMTLSFQAFLRISELGQLRMRDVKVCEKDGRMEIFIRRSKTDQFAKGESTFVFASETVSSPWHYRDVLQTMQPDERIVGDRAQGVAPACRPAPCRAGAG